MCCNKNVSKLLLFVFNIGFLLVGGLSLAMGVFILYDKEQILAILSRVPFGGDTVEDAIDKASMLESAAYVMIVAGGVVFGIAFLGFCGAFKNKKPLLYGYALLVLLILCMEIAAGVMGYIYKQNLDKNFKGFLHKTIKDYYKGAEFEDGEIDALKEAGKPVSASWDFAMVYFQCCGASNYSDFVDEPAKKWSRAYNYTDEDGNFWDIEDAAVPVTCCKTDEKKTKFPTKLEFKNVTACILTADEDYTNHQGCYGDLKKLYTKYTLIAGGVGIGVAVIEVFGIIAACCLIRTITKEASGQNV